jgi:hypothetical protein
MINLFTLLLKSSDRSMFRPPPGITDTDRSGFYYGTIDLAMKFTESFEVKKYGL